jgi:SAM-dependent methyltransferase
MTKVAEPAILSQVATYYASKLELHGSTPQGVDWNGEASHELRHQQFLRLLAGSPDASVLDLGCGYGDFLRFLREQGHRGAFIGYDVAPSMIEKACALHGEGTVPDGSWTPYVHETIDVLARAGRRGFAFNLLSLSSDPERRRANLYYADAAGMLSHCLARYGRSVALLQDYGLYEFTVVVRQSPAA